MSKPAEQIIVEKKGGTIQIVGLFLVVLSLLALLFWPQHLSDGFNAMVNRIKPIAVDVFLTGNVGMAIIASVITGRILERLGFTDALMKIFVPLTKKLGLNPAIIIPGVYNILGDINAAGRIAGPILVKAGATKDEQKIAITTMVQSQQSFSTFMLGLACLNIVGVMAFPVIFISMFLPLIIVPIILKYTIYKNTKAVDLEELPSFTPNTGALPTLFGAAREGAELLFLLIIPAAAAIFAIIGLLEYVGIWQPINAFLVSSLSAMSIHPETGILSIMASPTLAMATLLNSLKEAAIEPRLVVGSFVLAASGFPLSVIFGQIPAVWASASELNEKEAMGAAVLGAVMRVITATAIAVLLTPLFIK